MRVPTRPVSPTRSFAYLCALFVALLFLSLVPVAFAHHAEAARDSAPTFTQKQSVKLYPAFRAKLKSEHVAVGRDVLRHGRPSDGRLSWSLVRRRTRDHWVQLHPRSDAYLYWYAARPGVSLVDVWRATWRADGVGSGTQNFLICITTHEGGQGQVVKFGGSPILEEFPSTWPSGNTVGSWWQDRPGWINGSAPYGFRRAVYGADRWYASTVHYAHDPVAMARLNSHLTSEYATGHLC